MIVTISREYGASAQAVSRLVAPKLGYRLVDDELPQAVAATLGTTTDVVQSVENRPAGFAERVLRRLSGALPELSQPAALPAEDILAGYRREIHRLVHEAAHAGDVVIVGRVANAILGPRADIVRVFLYAPLGWRIEHVRASLGVDEATARSEIARIDVARRDFAEEQYDMQWGATASYDLLLDTSRYGIEGAADVIVAAVRAAENAPA